MNVATKAPTLQDVAPEDAGLAPAGLAAIDAALTKLVDDGVLAGVVTLVARRGRIGHRSAIGFKDRAAGETVQRDTIFRIFSMTKPVTASAMMILYDEGLWRPEDPISKFIPGFEKVRVFKGLDEKGAPITEVAEHEPTMRELMTHTAGFRYGFDENDPVDKLYQGLAVLQSANLAEMTDKLVQLPLAYQPGTQWLYSLSMDVQGAIIERLTGMSLPEFMRTRLFEPLGMVDTAFHVPPEKRHRLSKLYRVSPNRGTVETDRPLMGRDHETPPGLAMGGGGLFSTADDYARFAQMLLNGGELDGVRVVSAEALKVMMSNQLPDWMLEAGFGVGAQQIRPGFGYGFNGAVFTDPAKAGVPVGKGTYQWDGAAGTWFWVDPANDLLFVGMIQLLAPTGNPLLQSRTQTMMADAIV